MYLFIQLLSNIFSERDNYGEKTLCGISVGVQT